VPEDVVTPTPPREKAWLVLAIVMASAGVAQAFGRFTWGVVLPGARDDLLGGSNTLAGFFGTVNVTAYLAGTLFVSWASAHISLIGLVRLGLSISTVSLGIAAVAPNGWLLGLALIGMGIGGAIIWIPSPAIAARIFSDQRRGLAVGLVGSGIGLGIVFAGQVASFLGRSRQATEIWQLVYRIEFVIAVVVLSGTFLGLKSQGIRPAVAGGFGGIRALRNVTGWVPTAIAYSAFGFSYILVLAFLVARLRDDAGFTSAQAAAMFSLVGVAAVFGGITLGALSDWIGRGLTLTGSFTMFSACALLVLTGQQPWVTIAAIGAGLGFSGGPALITAQIVAHTDATTYGPAFSAATLAFGVAQMTSPQLGGFIADTAGSFTWVFVLSAAISMIGAIAAMRLP
jgi:predicted MFS family arabinose efflux permease